MNKQEFIYELKSSLVGLPEEEVGKSIDYYSEIIDDYIEDGISEEDAVASLGNIDEVVSQIMLDIPLTKLVKAKVKPNRTLRVWEIILLVLGSPIWLSLLIAVFAVILSFYISLWAVIISLWAVFVSVAVCVPSCILVGVFFYNITGVVMIATGLVCFGLSIFLFFGCKAATKGFLILTKNLVIWTKNRFIKGRENDE